VIKPELRASKILEDLALCPFRDREPHSCRLSKTRDLPRLQPAPRPTRYAEKIGSDAISNEGAAHARPMTRALKEIDVSAAVHLAFDELQLAYLAFGLPLGRAAAAIACCVHAIEPFVRVWRHGGRVRQRRERGRVLGGRDGQRGAVPTSPSARKT
jgi:hypothetical protein